MIKGRNKIAASPLHTEHSLNFDYIDKLQRYEKKNSTEDIETVLSRQYEMLESTQKKDID